MSNPVAIIGDSIPEPADPHVVRVTYTKIVYDSQKFFIYGENQYDPAYTTFDPTSMGEEFFMFIPMDNALSELRDGVPPGVQPDFVTNEAWGKEYIEEKGEGGLRRTSSGFVTAVNSIMPKIIVPSTLLVDNGIELEDDVKKSQWGIFRDAGRDAKLFNWKIEELNGVAIGSSDFYKYANIGGYTGSQYVSVKGKDDHQDKNEMIISLENPPTSGTHMCPQGTDHDWLATDSSDLVVGGAFVLMLNIVPSRPANASPEDVAENQWALGLEFGEVKMKIMDAGSTEVTIGIDSAVDELNKTTINLAEGKTKEGPPQSQHISEKEPYIILVYPVWNGIVVASGVQDARATVFSSSYYIPKKKNVSILNEPYSEGFDPRVPSAVEVRADFDFTEADCVMVDFGDKLTLKAENCRFDVAYLPCFFSKECWFDEWRIQSDDIDGVVSFDYNVYPIWTKNNTDAEFDPVPDVTDSGFAGLFDGSHYAYTQWRLKQDHYNRIGGAIFGAIILTQETRDFPIKNGNGNFNVQYSGGDPGDPSPGHWHDYVQNISVTTSLDGSSGTMSIDKYGIAGQHADVEQSIGAVIIDATGGNDTTPGRIFSGLGMGISDNKTSAGAMWSVNLVGLERKMDDIVLINVPFFDGERFYAVARFLCNYCGLIPDFTYADTNVRLSVSTDINIVRFDWKVGTTIKTALDEACEDTLHHYVVRDGKVYFYKLNGTTGLPSSYVGTNWLPQYPNVKVVSYDASPDFDDMRNEVAVAGLEQNSDGKNTELEQLPVFPRIAIRGNISTTPDIPWARAIVSSVPGYMDLGEFEDLADKLASSLSVYYLMGRTTVPGNASIKPYDRWGDLIIESVTHNMDLRAKTWTTDLQFMRASR